MMMINGIILITDIKMIVIVLSKVFTLCMKLHDVENAQFVFLSVDVDSFEL